MIEVGTTADEVALKSISEAIGGISYKAPTILKDAVNATGKNALKKIRKKIEDKYDTSSKKIDLQKALRRQSATYANPRTIITAVSPVLSLGYFNVNPRQVAHGRDRPAVYRGAVLKGEQKELVFGKYKGFMVRFKSGHEDVVVRTPGSSEIKTLKSPSVRSMTRTVYQEEGVEAETIMLLQKNLNRYIDRFLKARNTV